MDFSLRELGLNPNIVDAIHEVIDFPEDSDNKPTQHAPTRAYLRDRKAMAATPADVKEYSNSYVFVLDMPGLKRDQIKVHVEDDNILVVSGERRRGKEKDRENKDALLRYIRMERRFGKYLKKFALPENADVEKISAVYQDGVLTVTVEKKPPPEAKQSKTIEVVHVT